MELMYVFIGLGIILLIFGMFSNDEIKIELSPSKNKNHKIIFLGGILGSVIVIAYVTINALAKNMIDQTNTLTKNYEKEKIYQADNRADEKREQEIEKNRKMYEEQEYLKNNNIIKLGNEYHWNGIKEYGETRHIEQGLSEMCNDNDDVCRIKMYFDYVKNVPYQKGNPNHDKNAIEVINEWKGDCDEKSHLLASLMIEGGYETILIYSNQHTFAAVNIPNFNTNERASYLEFRGKKYYYAETTDKNAYLGSYNMIHPKSFKHAYDVNEKREIPLNEISAKIYL